MSTISEVFLALKDIKYTLSDIVRKASIKEKYGNQKSSDCLMRAADRLDLMIKSIRGFYLPKEGNVFNVENVYVSIYNDRYLLELNEVSNSSLSAIATGTPLYIKTNSNYEFDVIENDKDYIDYYVSVTNVVDVIVDNVHASYIPIGTRVYEINLTSTQVAPPLFTESDIDCVFVAEACDTEENFNRIYQEIATITNENC